MFSGWIVTTFHSSWNLAHAPLTHSWAGIIFLSAESFNTYMQKITWSRVTYFKRTIRPLTILWGPQNKEGSASTVQQMTLQRMASLCAFSDCVSLYRNSRCSCCILAIARNNHSKHECPLGFVSDCSELCEVTVWDRGLVSAWESELHYVDINSRLL
jgi:hypothetical protein